MAKICVISDFDDAGSGYKNLCTPLLDGLADMGHEIKVTGLGYKGREHSGNYSIIPADTIQDAYAVAYNLHFVWQPDLYLVAMDIPLQEFFYQNLAKLGRKYVAITPLENGPLTMSWAAILLNIDAVFFISELGKQEAIKAGLSKAEHLVVGVDSKFWHPATQEEKSALRKGLGIGEDEFVVLTVADNQERKNLWAGMESVKLLKEQTDRKIRYVMVTRLDSQVGWKLNDLALEMGLTKNMMFFNRGIPAQDLWGLFAVSDVYLQPSKAEGLGMPVLEAMACGIPCVATDTGALHELLLPDRGFLISAEYTFRDVWGNSERDMIDVKDTSECLNAITLPKNTEVVNSGQLHALEYVRSRTWDIPVQQLHNKIIEIIQ